MSKRNRAAMVLGAAMASMVIAGRARAATPIYWEGDAGTSWEAFNANPAILTNWSTTQAGTGDESPSANSICTFSATGATNFSTVVSNAESIYGIEVLSGQPAIGISINSTLTVGAGGITNGSVNTLTLSSGTLASSVGDLLTSIGASATVNISSAIGGGTSQLHKIGAGTLTLSGINTYTGLTTVSAGTLVLNGANDNNTIKGNLTVDSGATLQQLNHEAVADTSNITINGTWNMGVKQETFNSLSGSGSISSGGIVMLPASAYVGTFSGTLANLYFIFNNSTQILTGNSTVGVTSDFEAGTLQLGNGGTSGAFNGLINMRSGTTLIFDRSNALTHSAVIQGVGSVVKNGGGTLTLSAANTYTGTTTINGGTLSITGSSTSASTVVNNGGTLRVDSFNGWAGYNLTVNAGGTATTGNNVNNDVQNVTLAGGTVSSGTPDSTYGSWYLLGNITATGGVTSTISAQRFSTTAGNHNVTVDPGSTLDVSGFFEDPGAFTKLGTGTLVFSGNQTYSGGTTISAGTLQVGNGGTTGSIATSSTIINNGNLAFNRSDNLTQGTHFSGSAISGSGSLTKQGAGTLTLTAANTYTGGTTFAGGILNVGSAGALGSSGSLQFTGGTLQHSAANQTDYSARIVNSSGPISINTNGQSITYASALASSNSGGLTKLGAGTLTLTAANTYTGGTTISSGSTLQIGNGGNTGSITGNVANSGLLQFNRSNDITYGGAISGTGSVRKFGNGTLTLTAASSFSGPFLVSSGSVVSSGDLAPGSITVGPFPASFVQSGVTVTTGGVYLDNNVHDPSYFLAGGQLITSEISALDGDRPGGTFDIDGGTLVAAANSEFFNYLQPTVNAGGAIVNTAGFTATIHGAILHNPALGATADGGLTKIGAGTLVLLGDQFFQAPSDYNGGTTINAGTLEVGAYTALSGGGAVTLANAAGVMLDLNGNSHSIGALSGGGASGGTITLGSAALTVSQSTDTTYAGTISGAGSLTKSGAGMLTLTGASTYAGDTTISAGTLQIGNGGTTGSINSNITNNGSLVFNRSDSVHFFNVISGTGSLIKLGADQLFLVQDCSYTGGTTITAGTLVLGVGSGSGMIVGDVVNNGALRFQRGGNYTFGGVISGTGSMTVFPASGGITLTLTGASNYTGGTSIHNSIGTLQIGNGGTTGSIIGNVTFIFNAKLVFNRSNDLTFGGVISGSGSVTKLGAGTLTLTGANTYTRGTTINQGTLEVGHASTLGASGSITFTGGTLRHTGANQTDYSARIANSSGPISINTNGQNVTYASPLASSNVGGLTKLGTGTLNLTAANTYTGGTSVQDGKLALASNLTASSSISVTGGTLELSEGGGSSRVIKTQSVSVTGGGKIDLKDNKLIVAGGDVGSWNGSEYTGVTGLLQSGRNEFDWSGSGIVTSMTDATTSVLTTLAVSTAEAAFYDGGTFGDVSVNAGDVLVMYTWGGDADLNGELNGDDYFRIDSNILQSGFVFGYSNGDFNYDGALNGDDYFIIDSNIVFAQNSTPFPTSSGGPASAGLASIPEPASLASLTVAVLGLTRRRQRRMRF